MEKDKDKGITTKKEKDMPEWYSQVIIKGELADYSNVKGCIVIRPYGYSIWQNIMDYFNERLKMLNVKNAYFPLLIPEEFFKREAEHAQGFSPEVAWIESKDIDKAKYALRPTSETIMYDAYSRWIRSWRDLPLRINQWCNIIRWEVKDVKPFIRSREFLWQEGHCVYEDEEQCDREALVILNEYRKLANELLAIPVLMGMKTDKEKFAGALHTYTIEAFMPDGKALQLGTTHNLGQGFAKAFNIKYVDKDEKNKLPWQNSWGFSTRLIGALTLMHGDDKGLIIPPKIAPMQIVIIPIIFEEQKKKVLENAKEIKKLLKEHRVELDLREEYSAGWKFNEYELKGVPIRIEIGPRDIKKKSVVLVRRDTNKKITVKIKDLKKKVLTVLEDMQKQLYNKAEKFLKSNIKEAKGWNEFLKIIKDRKIAKAYFCGQIKCEDYIKEKTEGATSRCIPFEQPKNINKCVHCGEKGKFLVYFSKNY